MNDLEEYLLKAARMRPPTPREQEELVLEEEVKVSTPMLQRMSATPATQPTNNAADAGTAPNDPTATPRDSLQADALLRLLAKPSSLAQAFVLAELLQRPVERWERNW